MTRDHPQPAGPIAPLFALMTWRDFDRINDSSESEFSTYTMANALVALSYLITSADCASIARRQERRDRDGIVGPSMLVLKTHEAVRCRMSARSSCGGNDSMHLG
jgi:hypothetical protein